MLIGPSVRNTCKRKHNSTYQVGKTVYESSNKSVSCPLYVPPENTRSMSFCGRGVISAFCHMCNLNMYLSLGIQINNSMLFDCIGFIRDLDTAA